MRSINLLVLVLALAMVAGCAGSSKNLNALQLGMSQADVITVMGEPNSTSARGDVVYLNYRMSSGGLFSENYFVKLNEGKVAAYGRAGDFGLGR